MDILKKKKTIFISWTLFDNHSKTLADSIDSKVYFVFYAALKKIYFLPFRYLLQAIKTIKILVEENPNVVIVQNPPIILPMLIFIWGKIFGTKLIIDSHTAAFLTPPWKQFLFLHKYLSRFALTTIVTNTGLASIVKSWEANVTILTGPIPNISKNNIKHEDNDTNIVCISSFAIDEPINEVIEMAKNIPDIKFFITGDYYRLKSEILKEATTNIVFTGYLTRVDYINLLKSAFGIIDLTKRDYTLLDGGYEAVAVQVPLITSDWPVLKEYFNKGTLYTNNTKESLVYAVRYLLSNHEKLQQEIGMLKAELQDRFDSEKAELKNLINSL